MQPRGASATRRAFTNFNQQLGYNSRGGLTCEGTAGIRWEAFMLSLMEKLRQAQAEISEAQENPWKRLLERALPANVVSTSTVALLDLLGVPPTTGNARRLALTMRSMGWVGLKSRRRAPGGWRTTTCRGWARPIRKLKSSPTTSTDGDAGLNRQGRSHEIFC